MSLDEKYENKSTNFVFVGEIIQGLSEIVSKISSNSEKLVKFNKNVFLRFRRETLALFIDVFFAWLNFVVFHISLFRLLPVNIQQQEQLCEDQNGGHFQHLM